MKQLKSIYIGLLTPMLIILLCGNIFGLYSQGFSLGWLGSILTNLPFLIFLLRVMLFQDQPRTNPYMPTVSSLTIIGLGLTFWHYLSTGADAPTSPFPVLFGLVNSLLLLLYISWFSWLERPKSNLLAIGQKLPEFIVSKGDGTINSKQFIGKPAVIIFYRGSWCPFCVAQIKEVVARYQQAIYSGVQFVLISPQPDQVTQKLAQKFNVPFMFLTDSDNSAAKELGIVDENGLPLGLSNQGVNNNTVYPTVVVSNKEGHIIYCDETENYRFRADASEYLSLVVEN